MRTKTLSLFLLLSIASAVRTAEACSCATSILSDRDEAKSEFASATLVFEGEVLPSGHTVIAPIRGLDGLDVIVFRVIRSYKGVHDQSIQIYDEMAGSTCGFGQPKPGEKFFVYGYKGKDGKIYVTACTRTAGLESAGADIRYARGEPSTAEDSAPSGEKSRIRSDPTLATSGISVRGVVRRADGADVGGGFVKIWLTDAEGRREDEMAATQNIKQNGSYEVRYLSPGQYAVTAED